MVFEPGNDVEFIVCPTSEPLGVLRDNHLRINRMEGPAYRCQILIEEEEPRHAAMP